MIEVCRVCGAMLGGIGLGVFFFVGLWWTVQRGVTVEHPALLFLGSMLIRTLVSVAGFYYLSGGNWRNLVGGLTGFILARVIITRKLGPSTHRSPLTELGQVR